MDSMTVLKGVCIATGFAMHVAPLSTMREITAARSTLNFSIAPYASILLNHTVNLWYAACRADGPLIVHRLAGIAAQAYYLRTYITFAPLAKAGDNRRWLQWVAALLAAVAFDLHVVLPLAGARAQYTPHLAVFGAITGIGLAASPLATVGEVLRTRDASSLPAHLCAMVTLQCSAWTLYGYLRDDWSTTANNAVGIALGSAQLGLIAVYGNSRAGRPGGPGAAHVKGDGADEGEGARLAASAAAAAAGAGGDGADASSA